MKSKRCSYLLLSLLVSVALGLGFAYEAQAATPAGGMTFVTQVPIPNWTTTGANQASTDIFSTNPVTDTIYFADRVNRGVSVINGTSLKYLGTIPVPTCTGTPGGTTAPGSCPSGVQVAPDLQKLIVTDRSNANPTVDLTNIFIYDLKVPTAPPIQLTTGVTAIVGGGTSAAALDTDEIEYDPINQRAYVANSKCPCFLTVVDVVNGTIVDQIPTASNLEQPRFNPVDGMIYQTMPDDGTTATGGPNDFVLRIDPSKTGAAAKVAQIAPPSGCAVRGIDIDPITNTAVVACAAPAPAFLLSLSGSMSILNPSLSGVTGTDGELFNPNNRRWYTGSSNNTVVLAATLPGTSTPCPSTNGTTTIPAVGVYQVTGSGPATLVGADCSGVNGHGVGVDAFHNSVYIAARQFPADPASLSTGKAGILVWHDAAPLSQGFVEQTTANISSVGGSTATGAVLFQDNRVWASLSGLGSSVAAGSLIRLIIPTSLGNAPVECISNGAGTGTAICVGFTRGYPLFGGTVLLGVRGQVVGSGLILSGTTGD
jgi:hypothetical protein